MMVKDPLDGDRTLEIPFDGQNFTETPATVEPVEEAEPEFKSTLTPGAAEAAQKSLRDRSFSGRNPHLGKMIKCAFCGHRHRQVQMLGPKQYVKCEQQFTYTVKGYEYFREDPETGKLVPYYRTAIDPEMQPTAKQVVGAARFAKQRRNPHPSALKLQLVERTRKVFAEMGFTILEGEQAQKNMAIARKEALRQIINERRAKRIAKRNQTKLSRRINWGLR